jgi:hemerythrin
MSAESPMPTDLQVESVSTVTAIKPLLPEWNGEILVGHAEIDAQHHGLLEIVESLLAASSHDIQVQCAKSLLDATREHLAFEELLMEQSQYAEAEGHRLQHAKVLSLLDKISHGIADRSLDAPSLQKSIVEWLITHISTDVDLATEINSR